MEINKKKIFLPKEAVIFWLNGDHYKLRETSLYVF